MKKIILFVAVICLVAHDLTIKAQLPQVSTSNQKTNIANLLTQFATAIKPGSFLEGWAAGKSNWFSKASKAVKPSALAGSVSSLAGFINPGMFKNGFNFKSLQATATAAKTMSDASEF